MKTKNKTVELSFDRYPVSNTDDGSTAGHKYALIIQWGEMVARTTAMYGTEEDAELALTELQNAINTRSACATLDS